MKEITSGTIASPGIKIGKAYIYRGVNLLIPKYTVKEDEVDKEIQRFQQALIKTKNDIEEIREQIAKTLSQDLADIFSSHLLALDDPLITSKVRKTIIDEKRNVEWVINDISMELIESLSSIEDSYLRERIVDISDINKRLLNHLQETVTKTLNDIEEEVIVFAKDLTPSDTATMNKKYVLAFVTDTGGRTSHTAIIARALEIPAIVGTTNTTSIVKSGDMVIVDAIHGKIIIDPDNETIDEYKKYQADLILLDKELSKITKLPSTTLDNEDVYIYGNIEIPEEMKIIKNHGAQGIGLYRSEFLFLDKELPDEERQFQAYKSVIEFFNPYPVTIRTIDVGGDKVYAYNKSYSESNPFLGCRAIRFSLENKELFRTQIRAILRASHFGNTKLMFPMISTMEELLTAREMTNEVMKDLDKEGIPYNPTIPIGIMIEVPSAAINADKLAKYSDFFSVGTNDLVQYTIAVDRMSEKIAYLYNPADLAIIRLLKNIVDIANDNNKPVALCGEMAGEPRYTMLLLGLGFRILCMGTAYMYQIKRIIRSVKIQDCRDFVEGLFELETTAEIEKKIIASFQDKFPMFNI